MLSNLSENSENKLHRSYWSVVIALGIVPNIVLLLIMLIYGPALLLGFLFGSIEWYHVALPLIATYSIKTWTWSSLPGILTSFRGGCCPKESLPLQ
jgi:hypothetical protein